MFSGTRGYAFRFGESAGYFYVFLTRTKSLIIARCHASLNNFAVIAISYRSRFLRADVEL